MHEMHVGLEVPHVIPRPPSVRDWWGRVSPWGGLRLVAFLAQVFFPHPPTPALYEGHMVVLVLGDRLRPRARDALEDAGGLGAAARARASVDPGSGALFMLPIHSFGSGFLYQR